MSGKASEHPLLFRCPPLAAWLSEAACAQNAERAARGPEPVFVGARDPIYTCPGCPGVRALYRRGKTPEPRELPEVTPLSEIRSEAEEEASARSRIERNSRERTRARGRAEGPRTCRKGHAVVGENVAPRKGRRPECRLCQRAANEIRRQQYRARQRAAKATPSPPRPGRAKCERNARILHEREIERLEYAEIAEREGISPGRACQIVRREIRRREEGRAP